MTRHPSPRIRPSARALCPLLLLAWIALLPALGIGQEAGPASTPPGTLEFVGRNLFSKARGSFHDWRVVEASVDLERIEEAFARVEVQLDSLDTGIERRDEHLRTADFFETGTYPVARVRVHSPRALESDSPDEARFSVRFDIDLHGVQKTLDGEVTLVGTEPLVFEGGLTLDRTEFGIGGEPSRWNPMSPKAEIPVHFRVELEASKPPSAPGS